MIILTITQARAKLYKVVDMVAVLHEPVQIMGKRYNAVLVSEEDWKAIQETLYLLSIPFLRETIRIGLKTSVGKCSDVLY